MSADRDDIVSLLVRHQLKVTPQRIAVIEALHALDTHPAAEEIIAYVKTHHPAIATGTVYAALDLFARHGIITRVKTGRDVMRYELVTTPHHHLYCAETERIEDYVDPELDALLTEHFRRKRLRNFRIADIRLQILGRFTDSSHT